MTSTQGGDPGLPSEQLEEIFQQIIVPDYLLRPNPQPRQHPEAILLGGQPGVGKSTTAPQFHREFTNRGGLVWVTCPPAGGAALSKAATRLCGRPDLALTHQDGAVVRR